MTRSLRPGYSRSGVLVRQLTADDVPALLSAVRESMDTVGAWMPWCHPDYSAVDAANWVSRCEENWASRADREFGIFDAASGEILGCAGLNQLDPVNRLANLGYWVRKSRTGRGIATAAIGLIAKFGFVELGLSRIEIVARLDNRASRRAAEKAGATFEGIARNRLLVKERPCDAAVYSLLPGDVGE